MPIRVIETRIAASPERCFELSLSIDAHTASMRHSRERAVAGVTRGQIGMGESVTWEARHFGVRFRMTSQITALEFPTRFVDEQIQGPFAYWWHEHCFAPEGSGTLMVDRVSFRAPFGLLGSIAEAAVLSRYVERLIRSRNRWLQDELERKSESG